MYLRSWRYHRKQLNECEIILENLCQIVYLGYKCKTSSKLFRNRLSNLSLKIATRTLENRSSEIYRKPTYSLRLNLQDRQKQNLC